MKLYYISFFIMFSIAACGASNPSNMQNNPIEKEFNCFATQQIDNEPHLEIRRLFNNYSFQEPLSFVKTPNDDISWILVQKNGQAFKLNYSSPQDSPILFLDLSSRVSVMEECGLLNIAFHPDFHSNHLFYAYFTIPIEGFDYSSCGRDCTMKANLSSFLTYPDIDTTNLTSEQTLLSIERPWPVHHGGGLEFGPDGYLYLSIGDGGGSFEDPTFPQDLSSLNGKLIRIDVDQSSGYSIPPENPFINGGGAPEIFAWGFRNPWRWSFDRHNGDIWEGDVGLHSWEEINIITAGGNYGWPNYEGYQCNSGACGQGTVTFPISIYSHDTFCSITGGFVYRGSKIPSLFGVYIFADFCSGDIYGLFPEVNGEYTTKLISKSGYKISSFAQDNEGEIYFLDFTGGGIYQITDYIDNGNSTHPIKLSESGCVIANNPKHPAPNFIPYDVNLSFWSDGASKLRWMLVPDNQKILFNDDESWSFPAGSIFLKNFFINNKIVETRILSQIKDDVWAGYSFEWNEDQTDAFLIPENGKTKWIAGQSWTYPSRSQCLRCHNNSSGNVLGIKTAQMNKTLWQGGQLNNQISYLQESELLQSESEIDPDTLVRFPSALQIRENKNLTRSARAYLDTNCANCHRPGGPGVGPADFRFSTSLFNMNICDVTPTVTNLGNVNAKILSPGSPDNSILLQRMKHTDHYRMPPISSSLVDEEGVNLISEWIKSLSSCNEN